MLGQRVMTLVDGVQPAGLHDTPLDTRAFAAGVYVIRAEVGGRVLARTLTVAH